MPGALVPLEVALASRQQRFYADAGQAAFAGTVPFRLSTSRAMARLVVQAARVFARAQGKPLVRLVDVGAGTGRLGYHVRALDPDVHLVLTDASAAMCEALRAHPQLAGATVVHAPADALSEALAADDDEALVLVGTYLLDTLPHALVEAPSGHRAFVDDAGVFTFRPAPLDAFTRAYVARLGHGRAFVPVGSFDFIRALERSLPQPALLLLGDKMATSLDAAREGERPRLVPHGAGASVLVNLDALRGWLGWRRWTQARGGSGDYVVGATVLGGRCPTAGLFDGATHPLDAQARVTKLRHAAEVVRGVLALEPDGDALLELSDTLVDAASHDVDEALRQPLAEWLLETARTAFVLPADDVAFHAGRVLQVVGFAGAAVACFSESLARHGDVSVTRLFRATSLLALGALDRARDDVGVVLQREPGNAHALALREATGR
jgi:hypothetical protein